MQYLTNSSRRGQRIGEITRILEDRLTPNAEDKIEQIRQQSQH